MAKDWKDIAKAILETVEGRAKKFLDDNKDARDFLKDRAERYAKVYWSYMNASDGALRDSLKRDLEIVKQSIENEVSTVAVKAATEARNLFKAILGTALDMLIKALPALV